MLQLVDQGRIRVERSDLALCRRCAVGRHHHARSAGPDAQRSASTTPRPTTSCERLYGESPDGPDAFALTPRDLLDIAFALPMDFAPATRLPVQQHEHGAAGHGGREGHRVMPLGDYLQQNIFGPLASRRPVIRPTDCCPARTRTATTRHPTAPSSMSTLWNPSWGDAAGKIVSTVADMRKLWAVALGRGTLLRAGVSGAAGVQTAEHRSPAGIRLRLRHLRRAAAGSATTATSPGTPPSWCTCPERDATLVVIDQLRCAGSRIRRARSPMRVTIDRHAGPRLPNWDHKPPELMDATAS